MTITAARAGDLVGYARVSTAGQHLDLQTSALGAAGCVRIFEEKVSGTKTDRPELDAAFDYLREGDTLVVWRLDRLGRSLPHLISLVADLETRGVGFRSIHEGIDTGSAVGRLTFNIFGALAQFERDLIIDRTQAGLEAARARGSKSGRKPSLSEEQVVMARQMAATGEQSIAAIARALGVSRATVYRAIESAPAAA